AKRSCRCHLYALTHKADNIPRIAELLPSRHYRNRYPPDKMSLAPKARGLFSQNTYKIRPVTMAINRPTHYLQMAHDMLLAQLPELLRRALCSQTLPNRHLQIMSANHHPSEFTEPIGKLDINKITEQLSVHRTQARPPTHTSTESPHKYCDTAPCRAAR